MTTTAPDQQTMRIALAEAMGWRSEPDKYYSDRRAWLGAGERCATSDLPDPFSDYADLAAAREAICDTDTLRALFVAHLCLLVTEHDLTTFTRNEVHLLLTAPLATQATALYRVLRGKEGK